MGRGQAGGRRHADSGKSKFIPTYAILYGNPKNARPLEETAKFDVLVASTNATRVWRTQGRNSWLSLKAVNPSILVFVYAMGPGEYNTANWGELGEGWEWMKRNHGNEAEDRWTARGAKHGTYLQGRRYPNERLMDITKAGWHEYWIKTLYQDYWGGGRKLDLEGVDGVFSDNTHFGVPWPSGWYRENSPDMKDDPVEFSTDGKYNFDRWREGMSGFLKRAVPWYHAKGVTFANNFESLGRHPDWWRELDSLPSPPFAAMDEGGFICPWGSGTGRFFTWDWEGRVRAMKDVRNVRILMNGHATVPDGEGLDKMDIRDSNGMNGWDALWFSMTSFLLGFDDVNRNAYMNFTLWGYQNYYWFDEFDPQYLHLGRARGDFRRSGEIWLREFDDGYVAVNPGKLEVNNLETPAPKLRVLNHANFRKADEAPLVSRFDLPARRGVILLKPGRQISNKDNPER